MLTKTYQRAELEAIVEPEQNNLSISLLDSPPAEVSREKKETQHYWNSILDIDITRASWHAQRNDNPAILLYQDDIQDKSEKAIGDTDRKNFVDFFYTILFGKEDESNRAQLKAFLETYNQFPPGFAPILIEHPFQVMVEHLRVKKKELLTLRYDSQKNQLSLKTHYTFTT